MNFLRTLGPIILIYVSLASRAPAHRLDEYLQTTFFSFGSNRVTAEMFLTPGVAVLPQVLLAMDPDGDGEISAREQRTYSENVLRDLLITVNGEPISPQLVSFDFPKPQDLTDGLGRIRLEFKLELPSNVSRRHLKFENHHLVPISVYQVNSLVPANKAITINSEERNYSQSLYDVDYSEIATPVPPKGIWDKAQPLPVIISVLAVITLLIRAKRPSRTPSRGLS